MEYYRTNRIYILLGVLALEILIAYLLGFGISSVFADYDYPNDYISLTGRNVSSTLNDLYTHSSGTGYPFANGWLVVWDVASSSRPTLWCRTDSMNAAIGGLGVTSTVKNIMNNEVNNECDDGDGGNGPDYYYTPLPDGDYIFAVYAQQGTCTTTSSLSACRAVYYISVEPDPEYDFTVGSGGTPDLVETNILFPINSTTSIPDFSDWIVSATGTLPGRINIRYGQNSSSLLYSDSALWTPAINSPWVVIPKSTLLNPIINLAATSTWYAQVEFISGTSTIASQGLISFVIDPQADEPVLTTTTYAAGPFLSFYGSNLLSTTSTSDWNFSVDCSAYSLGWTEISGDGLYCYAKKTVVGIAQFFFQPSPSAGAYITGSINSLKRVFPFSAIYSVTDQIAQLTSTTTIPTGNYDLNLPFPNRPTVLTPLLTSSTLENAVGSSTKDLIFDAETSIIWLGTIALIISILL